MALRFDPTRVQQELEVAYQIGSFICKQGRTDHLDRSKPWYDSRGHFLAGPNEFSTFGTCQGLILEEEYGAPTAIYTACGRWSILESRDGNGWAPVLEKLKERMELKVVSGGLWSHRLWVIQKFDDTSLGPVIIDQGNRFRARLRAQDEWIKFRDRHSDLHTFAHKYGLV